MSSTSNHSWKQASRRKRVVTLVFLGVTLFPVITNLQMGAPEKLSLEANNSENSFAPLPRQSEPSKAAEQIRVSSGVQQAKLISSPKIEYPPIAKSLGVEGSVVLEAVISTQGAIENLEVISGNHLLVRTALESVWQWRYRPTLLNGEAVEVVTTITVNFSLAEGKRNPTAVAKVSPSRPGHAKRSTEDKANSAALIGASPAKPMQTGQATDNKSNLAAGVGLSGSRPPNAEHATKIGSASTALAETNRSQTEPAKPVTESKPASTNVVETARLRSQFARQVAETKPEAPAVSELSRTQPEQTERRDPEFIIGPEDGLSINVWREPELSTSVVVRPDGKITLPLIDEIQASGLTAKQLQDQINVRLKDFVVSPVVTVMVKEIRSQEVTVMGEVNRTGVYPFGSPMTVVELIGRAGGFKEFAKSSKIRILRQEDGRQIQFSFNYKDYIKGKNPGQNIVLKNGDAVIVP
ncbi:MAG: TonB family protein [Terriglobia bacterium]